MHVFLSCSYRQAQASALEGLAKLRKLGIATIRPDDYYAEMAKSDAHMKKVVIFFFIFVIVCC